MDDIRRSLVGDLVRELDGIEDVQVRESADDAEEDNGLDGRVGCVKRKGAEHRSQHRTIQQKKQIIPVPYLCGVIWTPGTGVCGLFSQTIIILGPHLRSPQNHE